MTVPTTSWTGRASMLGAGFLLASVALIGCGSVLQGPGGDGGTGGGQGSARYDHPTGTDDVLLSINVDGGLVPLEYNLQNTPQFLLVGDGTVIVPGVMIEIYPGPAINPLQSANVSEGQIQELFAAADRAGLLAGEIDYGLPGITDVHTTTVTLTIDGRTVTQSAYTLSYQNELTPWLIGTALAARMAFRPLLPGDPGCG